MFACGTYPADEDFRGRIIEEVKDNLKRLRHHPSIVAWSGNNEDYLFAELFHTTYDIKDPDPEYIMVVLQYDGGAAMPMALNHKQPLFIVRTVTLLPSLFP